MRYRLSIARSTSWSCCSSWLKNVERMDVASRERVEDRMRELQRLLDEVRSAVAADGWPRALF